MVQTMHQEGESKLLENFKSVGCLCIWLRSEQLELVHFSEQLLEQLATCANGSVCCDCGDLLKASFLLSIGRQILAQYRGQCYDCGSFCLKVDVPVFTDAQDSLDRCLGSDDGSLDRKLLLKTALVSFVETELSMRAVDRQTAGLVIDVLITDEQDQQRCSALLDDQLAMDTAHCPSQRSAVKKWAEGLDAAEALIWRRKLALAVADGQSTRQYRVEFKTSTLYLTGRYCKFSRKLYQSPWLGSWFDSLQQQLQKAVGSIIFADRFKLSTAGREDSDVRMLGRGRPFVLHCLNPKVTRLTDDHATRLQSEINSSTLDFSVSELKLTTEEAVLEALKRCEEEKLKTYVALCRVVDPEPGAGVDKAKLHALRSLVDLTIHQWTPIRVVHRRAVLRRRRLIKWMRAIPSDCPTRFLITLQAEAGTYIKEFIHGDWGRTRPSLSDLLGIQLDILLLDVQSVD
ncbi:putative tRNA pseudouridine synthase Pus10 [Trichinella nativa]|uniref:tRNA pseudouridine(55) synthase n=1 Tax=Trichinella nativa TaxID=6335 RepID=A0A0V1LVR2_9BILA|nr:putative tRNA pseudouridine synthase Pus10 [Trichinella nativa]OUC49512.1 TIGR01213 family protein [Trichinella nativa]